MKSTSFVSEKDNDSSSIQNINTERLVLNDSINVLRIFNARDSIKVYYLSDTLSIEVIGKKTIKIFYKSPIDFILPCVGLYIKEGQKLFSYQNHYFYKNNILLLPVQDINNRVNLFVINLDKGNLISIFKPFYSDFLITAYPWFGFNSKTGVIVTTNSIPLQGKTTIHKFILYPDLRYLGTFKEKIEIEGLADEKLLVKTMKKLLN